MRKTIDVLVSRYVDTFNQHDVEGFTSLFAEDARLMAPYSPAIEGRAAIHKAMPGFWEMGFRDLALTSSVVSRHDDVVIDSGRYRVVFGAGSSLVEDEGKDIRIWRQEPDGSWALTFDIWNSDLAPPG